MIVRCQMAHHDLVSGEKEEREEKRREERGVKETRFGFSDQVEKVLSLLFRIVQHSSTDHFTLTLR